VVLVNTQAAGEPDRPIADVGTVGVAALALAPGSRHRVRLRRRLLLSWSCLLVLARHVESLQDVADANLKWHRQCRDLADQLFRRHLGDEGEQRSHENKDRKKEKAIGQARKL
jgi:hypothetical protein